MKRHAPAAGRNREPIAAVLGEELPDSGLVLEVASGTGEHAVHFARTFPWLDWQPSDPDADARASIAAWGDEEHVRENRRLYAEKFDAVLPLLPGAEKPHGGFYLWLATPIDDAEFARRLHAEYNVLVLPGSYLAREAGGANPGRNRVRIALVSPLAECVEAIGRLSRFMKNVA